MVRATRLALLFVLVSAIFSTVTNAQTAPAATTTAPAKTEVNAPATRRRGALRHQRRGRSLSRQNAARAARPLQRLLRRRLLAASVGFPRECLRDVVAAALPLVRAHARPGRAHHPLPPAADGALLDPIHSPHLGTHLSDDRIRRLFPRTQVRPAESDLRTLDARSSSWAWPSAWSWERSSSCTLFWFVRRLGKSWWVWGAV